MASFIADGDLSDGELLDLSYRIAREFKGRLESIRLSADEYLQSYRQQADRIRELERTAGPDAATA